VLYVEQLQMIVVEGYSYL